MAKKVLLDEKSYQVDVAREGFVEKYPMDFGRADRLSVFSNYQFFTPAPLYLYGGFTDYVWAQLMQELNRDIVLMFYKFNCRVFRGLDAPNGDKDWNHALWAVTREQWQFVESYLLSLVFMHKQQQRVHKIGVQDLQIVDPLYLDTCKVISPHAPLLEVASLGVNGNKCCIAFTDGTTPPLLQQLEPQEKMRKFANRLFGGLDNTKSASDHLETHP